MPSHAHVQNTAVAGSGFTGTSNSNNANSGTGGSTDSTGGGGAHSNTQPWLALEYIIYASV
jgi:microcystin-dependent protein